MMPDREKVIKGLEDWKSFGWGEVYHFHFPILNDALELLQKQQEEIESLKQTVQSMMEGGCLLKEQEAVVRCKDCKQGEQSVLPNRHLWCRIHEFYREPGWFCADGERRSEDA